MNHMTIRYRPKGVCSHLFEIEVEEGRILSVRVEGGCSGNLQGLSSLLRGMEVKEAIGRLGGGGGPPGGELRAPPVLTRWPRH